MGSGYIENSAAPVKPQSLFRQQLANRTGKNKAMAALK